MSVLTAYQRFRFLWGAVDWEGGTDSPYTSAQTGANLGTSAAPGAGVGVRRCVLHFDRSAIEAGLDDAECHFDFLNITGGTPDDTWTSTDYTTLEGFLDTFWNAIRSKHTTNIKLSQYSWYRHGPGIVAPNPAERVTSRSIAGSGTSDALPPQVAQTITFRTAVRRSWGRTYLPGITESSTTAGGDYATADVDVWANAAGALLSSAVGADFPLVVTSVHLNAVLNVEHIECDDVPDIIRRRRFKHALYKKILP